MNNQTKYLQGLIIEYLNDNLSFEEFDREFYWYYIDEYEEESEINFDEITEKLEYTSDNEPDVEERKYGWINSSEFKNWLELNKSKYLIGQ